MDRNVAEIYVVSHTEGLATPEEAQEFPVNIWHWVQVFHGYADNILLSTSINLSLDY